MRAYDQESAVRVTVSAAEVYNFKRHWPCSTLPSCGVCFIFEKRNGDLIDIFPDSLDGEDALALSHDASNYAASRLGIASLKR